MVTKITKFAASDGREFLTDTEASAQEDYLELSNKIPSELVVRMNSLMSQGLVRDILFHLLVNGLIKIKPTPAVITPPTTPV